MQLPPSCPRRVALFATCLVDQLFPEVGLAAARLVRRAGSEVTVPRAQTCCGQPFFNSGFRPQAVRLAKRTVELLEPQEAVVVPGGSCVAMMRVEYPALLQEEPEWEGRARRLAAKTYELSEFLLHLARWCPPTRRDAPALTYHDSCHMCRRLGLRREPRQLLRAAGCSLAEMAESDRCCGFGGLFSLRMPELANAMGSEKLAQAKAAGGTLVTADPGCLLHLSGLVAKGQRVAHLAVVLEELTA